MTALPRLAGDVDRPGSDEPLVVDRDALAEDLRSRVFPAPATVLAAPRIGAEVELIPVDAVTRRPLPLDGGPVSTLSILRRAAEASRWTERHSTKAGVPEILVPSGGVITFEPGGQVEISAAPNASLTDLVAELRATVHEIRRATPPGVALLSVGIDPETPVEAVAPQLPAERYQRMLAYFQTIGPSGARMMRQTASFQVCVDGGAAPWRTWRVLNALAPYMVAMFANSPRYAGRSTGHRSFRREIWATLDPRRTGVFGTRDDGIEEYLDFALQAPAFLLGDDGAAAMPFGCWLDREVVTPTDWTTHLSTLFPEVRPRGYFELRSSDVVPPEWYAVPLVFACGLVYHEPSLEAAADLLGCPSPALLARSGLDGLAHPILGRLAPVLCDLALDGCAALGRRFVSPTDLASAAEYFDRFTRRGRCLADDVP